MQVVSQLLSIVQLTATYRNIHLELQKLWTTLYSYSVKNVIVQL